MSHNLSIGKISISKQPSLLHTTFWYHAPQNDTFNLFLLGSDPGILNIDYKCLTDVAIILNANTAYL